MKTMTLGDFRARVWDQIKGLPDDTELLFGSADAALTIHRWKSRATRPDGRPKLVQIEFNELYTITSQ